MTLRTRLVRAAAATLAVGLGVLLLVGNVLLARRVDVERSSLLHARADAQVAALAVDGGRIRVRETPNDTVLDRRSWVVAGDRVIERPAAAPAKLDRAAIALGRAGRDVEREGPDHTRLLARTVRARGVGAPVGAVVVAVSVRPLERLEHLVLVGSLVLAALILLAGIAVIRRAVDGALSPVARMTADAREWGAHDLDRRFDLGPPGDELTSLAATLDGLLARIAASRRHEQRFASDAAHELRTPLAAMRGRAEFALGSPGARGNEDRRAALLAVVEQCERLGATVDALLAVAREEFDPSSGSADLVAVARGFEGVDVVAAGVIPRVEGETEVVRRALAPLVDNARRHARERVAVELAFAGDRVRATVRDDGPGLDADLGERAFEPGVRGGEAAGAGGLGLPLARRLARSCGGDVHAGDGPGGCFVLELPVAAGDEAQGTNGAIAPSGSTM